MLGQIKTEWRRIKDAPPGARFVQFHERHAARQMPFLKAAWFFVAVFCVGMGLLLSVTSGPGLLFLAFAALLLPAESRTVAALLDRVELTVRRGRGAIAAKQRSRTSRLTTTKGRLDKDELERAATASEHATPKPSAPAPQAIRTPTQQAASTPAPQTIRTPAPDAHPAPRNTANDQKVVWITPPPPKAATRPAGTIKMWSSSMPQVQSPLTKPEPTAERPKSTIVMFPPPVHVASSESRRRTGDPSG